MLNFNTNLQSLLVRRSLQNSTNILNQAIERMSTGMKINSAKDNAANFAISTQMTTQLSALDVAEDNTAQGLDLITTASETLELINERFTRLKHLAIQAENKTYGEESLKAINLECQSLVEDIKTQYRQAEYNGLTIYGNEFFETVNTDGSAPINIFSVNPDPVPQELSSTFATENTTLQELGIDESNFQIYNSQGGLIESYDTEKTDSLQDVFDVLSTYGFTSSITDGVVSISSNNGRYVDGNLIQALGITLNSEDFVASSSQISNSIYYTVTQTASEISTLADLGALMSGSDTVTVRDKYGDVLTTLNVNYSTTLGGLFNQLGNCNIQGYVDDGVITLTSSDGNYVDSVGVIANLGIGTVQGSNAVTTGTSQTSGGVVTYEDVIEVPGIVTTTTEERTVTIWTTTTSSETRTETIYTTSTTTEERTETIWTTTTTSETQTQTVTVTQTVAATSTTKFSDLSIADGTKAIIYNSSNSAKKTITISSTDTLGDFFTTLSSNTITASISNGIIFTSSVGGYTLGGDLATALNIERNYNNFSIRAVGTTILKEITPKNNNTVIGTSTVVAGLFKATVTLVETSTIESLSSVDETTDISSKTYKISTTDELIQYRTMSNNSLINNSTSIILDADLDMTGIEWDEGILFAGKFNGNGHTISNLTGSSGLFSTSKTYSDISVLNLGLINVNLNSSDSTTYIGGLFNTTSSSEIIINNCFVTGEINSVASAAGLIGEISGANFCIKDCYVSANITSNNSAAGLVADYSVNRATINNCYTEGSITGRISAGITGNAYAIYGINMQKIYSNADITGTSIAAGIAYTLEAVEGSLKISNIYFNGTLSADERASLFWLYTERESSTSTISYIRTNDTTVAVGYTKPIIVDSMTLGEVLPSSYDDKITITKDNITYTISIASTKTISEANEILANYDVFLKQSKNSKYNVSFYYLPGMTVNCQGISSSYSSSTVYYNNSTIANQKTSTSEEVVTSTLSTTTTTSSTNTLTVQVTTTAESTNTLTVDVTTTTSTTETETVEVTQTTGSTFTTSNVSMTSDTTFSQLGMSSRGYVTIYNDTTRTIVTVKTADTVSDLVSSLNRAGVSATLADGKLTLSPNIKSVYISGMSDNLLDILKLNTNFYTSSLGVDMTDSNMIEYNASTTINNSTSLSEIGVTSGALVVQKDGQEHTTIAVDETQSIREFTQSLKNAGFSVKCSNGAIQLESEGDMYLTNSAVDSSNAVAVLGLGNVNQVIESTYSNTDSQELFMLNEIVNTIWQARGDIALQVGTKADENNRISVNTGITFTNLDIFANIGKNMVNKVDYVTELDNILNQISIKQTELGAAENRLISAMEEINIQYNNLLSSRSTIQDADLAEESSRYIQSQILQQASATLLSVTNQSPQLALQLL